jgi:ankyrin repeat protein
MDVDGLLEQAAHFIAPELVPGLLQLHAHPGAAGAPMGPPALHTAVQQGQFQLVQQLLEDGVDVNARSPAGDTALHVAARIGSQELAAELLAAGADCDLRNNSDQTPLHVAFQYKQLKVLKPLVRAGADLAALSNGRNCFHMAAAVNRTTFLGEVLNLVKPAGQAVPGVNAVVQGFSPLHTAIEKKHMVSWGLLLELGADPDQLYGEGALDRNGESLAGASCLHRYLQVTGSFTSDLATPSNMRCVWKGETPLHIALRMAHTLLPYQLVARGSPALVPNWAGHTALDLAARSTNPGLRALVPGMVHNECVALKQQEGQQRQGQQARQQGGKLERVASGMYALLKRGIYQSASQCVSCCNTVEQVLGEAAATSVLQQLLSLCGDRLATAEGGCMIMLRVVRVLHGVWVSGRQPVWEFSSRLHNLVTRPLQQAQAGMWQQQEVAAAGGHAGVGASGGQQALVLQLQAAAAAAGVATLESGQWHTYLQLLGQLTGLQVQCGVVAQVLAQQPLLAVEGHSVEAHRALMGLCEALLAAWQQAAAKAQRDKVDGVVSAVQARSLQPSVGSSKRRQ